MSGTGFTFPWEGEAIRGGPLPEGLGLPDQLAYLSLRQIYRSYREEAISREEAVREKRLVRRSWEQAAGALAFSDRLTRRHAQILRGTEAAKTACRKGPTVENALRLCDVLDGLGDPPDV